MLVFQTRKLQLFIFRCKGTMSTSTMLQNELHTHNICGRQIAALCNNINTNVTQQVKYFTIHIMFLSHNVHMTVQIIQWSKQHALSSILQNVFLILQTLILFYSPQQMNHAQFTIYCKITRPSPKYLLLYTVKEILYISR